MLARAPWDRISRARRTGAFAASTWNVTDPQPASTYARALRSGSSIIRCASSGVSVDRASASTMVGPKVRFGTKWLSITSTCTQSALPIRRTSAPRFAKSALRMLGVIWMPTGDDPRGRRGSGLLLGVGRWARPLPIVAVGPVQERRQVEDVVVDVAVEVPDLGEPVRDREDGEVPGVDRVHLVPADRRGDAGIGQPADGVRRRDGVVAGVLVVVHEQLVGVPVLAPPGRSDVLGRAPRDLPREGQRGPAYVLEAVVGPDADVDVQSLAPAGLGEAGRPQLVEDLVGDVRDALHGREVAQRPRVEVDAPLVGLLGVLAAAVPRVELHGGHLHRPDHAGQLGDAELVGGAVPAREVQLHGLD